MFLRTLARAGVALLLAASVSITRAVSLVENDLDTTVTRETGHIELQSEAHSATGIRFVKNSGICETTPNVNQISGYIEVGTNMSMWFWFFESRNSPKTAPFTLWLNGGPGCSSMVGLFQENGPCLVNADGSSTVLNPYSWNSVSNMIYIDQPIGTGFSHGDETVNSTQSAAPFVWTAFQALFESELFSKYASREFIFATESYGGHYGPGFVTYFENQNALITSGKIKAVPIVVSALMINNGWFDPLIHYVSYLNYTTNAPGYGKLRPDGVLKNMSNFLYGPNGCVAQEKACYAAGNSAESNKICQVADKYCIRNVLLLAVGDFNQYDIRQKSEVFPPEYYVNYLSKKDVMKKIGAEVEYGECPDKIYNEFAKTGDDARTWLPQLSALVNSKMKILIWSQAAVLAMDWYGKKTLHNTPFTNMTLKGKAVAAVQNVDNFSFARVYNAGHKVPAFQPKTALEIFSQVIRKEQLHSV
ncbi:Alpha/Beta hydrolase protein [Suillus bovinus]|uniref:Alpha/Beta hydrolase protein n=1 Tax=Suillus bovinus TaxID=48563 RepID=UPI001B862472|nr:Alpha/Beta hydrolase protein [Suillus bovinus]KAG2130145.1 Alpha/Beta hydrolase protein [Suillus bovinus]